MSHWFAELTRLPRPAVIGWLTICVVVVSLDVDTSVAQQVALGTSSRSARKRTVESLPYHQLTDNAKQKLNRVLKNPSFYRRLPATSIEADPEYLQFLVRHPEVIVNIWQLMGVTKMSSERTGPFSLRTNDGAGTISDLELMFGTQNLHIFYGRGTYEGPVIRRPLSGYCVIVLKTNYQVGPSETPLATNELDVFLKVENATANLVAKTLQPLIGPTADHNFVESLKFVQRLNETTQKNGPGVQEMARRFTVTPKVRENFIQVAGNVFDRASHLSISKRAIVPSTPGRFFQTESVQEPIPLHEAVAESPAGTSRQYGHHPPAYQAYNQAVNSSYHSR